MNLFISRIFVLAIIFSFLSCETDKSPLEQEKLDIIPLKVGNRWIQSVTNYDSTGMIIYTKTDTIEVVQDTTIQNESWYKYEFSDYVTNRGDGFYDFQRLSNPSTSLLYKYPAHSNESYQYRGMNVDVISTSQVVQSNLGNFTCYYYRVGPNQSYSDVFIMPGIGIIKREAYNPLSNGNVYKYLSYELINYEF